MTAAAWWESDPILERHEGVLVCQEHHVLGGSKIRFLPHLVGDAREVVFGGPCPGGAPYALAIYAKMVGIQATLFYAERRADAWHWRQRASLALGAKIYQVPAGRMAVVQHRARTYAADHGALFLPLGFDVPGATAPYEAFLRRVAAAAGDIDEVWCACGSGMLTRCLARAFPLARIRPVAVGLESRHGAQDFPANVAPVMATSYDFAEPCRKKPPFPSCAYYDAKAWECCAALHKGRALFFNVIGNEPQEIAA